jgi:hypothetical protein
MANLRYPEAMDWTEHAAKWDADLWASHVLLKAWPRLNQAFDLARQLSMIRNGRLIEGRGEKVVLFDIFAGGITYRYIPAFNRVDVLEGCSDFAMFVRIQA